MNGPAFERPFYGVRQVVADEPSEPRLRLRRLCEQFHVRMGADHFFSHESALVLWGAPTPDRWKPVVHVSAYRPASAPRVRGVQGHRLQAREPAFTVSGGLRVENPVRAWVQSAHLWGADDLIAAGDFLTARRRPLASLDDLREEARHHGRIALRSLVDLVRDGCESARETRLRLLELRAGLPEPALNVDLRTADGRFVARVDQAFVRYRVAVEYDGRQHASDPAQFARDADRWDAIRAEEWDLVRILHHHLRGDGAPAIAKVRTALLRAGWPG